MLAKPITVAAVLAASATHAFLIPPEVAGSDVQMADAAAVAPASAESQLVKLDCPGCPMLIHGPRGYRVIPNKANHLELTFNVDHQPEGDRLLVNGFELHPNPMPGALVAPQIPDGKPWHHGPFGPGGRGPFGWRHRGKDHGKDGDDGGEPENHGLPPFLRIEPAPLGFAMQTHPVAARDPDSQLELVTIDFQVVEVTKSMVAGIPQLHIKLIKDASGRLMIGNIEQSASQTTDAAEPGKCANLLCKWIEAIFPKGPARPCHRQKHAPGSGPRPAAAGDDARGHWGSGMRHHHHHPSLGQLFKNIASHILLPVLIGIIAGVSISVIGMAVGTIVVSLWRTFVRRPAHQHHHRRRRSSHHHHHHNNNKTPETEAVVEEEKSGLMDHQDPPPSYEAETEARIEDAYQDKVDQRV